MNADLDVLGSYMYDLQDMERIIQRSFPELLGQVQGLQQGINQIMERENKMTLLGDVHSNMMKSSPKPRPAKAIDLVRDMNESYKEVNQALQRCNDRLYYLLQLSGYENDPTSEEYQTYMRLTEKLNNLMSNL